MAGAIFITWNLGFPWIGGIEIKGFPIEPLSYIDISQEKYKLVPLGGAVFDVVKSTEIQRFIVPTDRIMEI